MSNLLLPLKIIVSFIQSYKIMSSFKPHVVVGTGGYVSGPVLRAAIVSGIPTLIHEQNSYPGITTRLLAPKVTEVHLTFERTRRFLKGPANTLISGNPTRFTLEGVDRTKALQYFGFHSAVKTKTILLFGGSLGAHSLNDAMSLTISRLMEKDIRLIWQTGRDDFERISKIAGQYTPDRIWISPFIDRMDYAYSLSDLVVCRAGATTIAELTRLGKPSILVPYPYAAANHQVENALSLSDSGAAAIVYDHEIHDQLFPTIVRLIDSERLQQMGEKSKAFGKPEAASTIAKHIRQLAQKYGRP